MASCPAMVLAFSVAVVGCKRKHTATAVPSAEAMKLDSGTDAANHAFGLVDDVPLGCVATDALYVLQPHAVLRFGPGSAAKRIPLPDGLRNSTQWSARGDWLAWMSAEETGTKATLHTWSISLERAGPTYETNDSIPPFKLGPRHAVVRMSAPICRAGAVACPSGEGLEIVPLDGTRVRYLGVEAYLAIPAFAADDQGIVAAYDFRTKSPSLATSTYGTALDKFPILPSPKTIATFAGVAEDDWPNRIAANATSVFYVTRTDIEVIARAGSAPRIVKAGVDATVIDLLVTPRGLLVVRRATPQLEVLDTAAFTTLHTQTTEDVVEAAWAEDYLVWCTARGVFRAPLR